MSTTNEQIPGQVYKSIVAVMGELAKIGIAKTQKNAQQGYMFRGIDAVYQALAPLLAQNQLCILPRITQREVVERSSAKGNALFYTTVTAEFDIISAVDGSQHAVRSYGEALDSGDKSVGKAMSYAYKAMAFMTFAIPTEGDNDTENASHEVQYQPTDASLLQQMQRHIADIEALSTIQDLDLYVAQHKASFLASPHRFKISEFCQAKRAELTQPQQATSEP